MTHLDLFTGIGNAIVPQIAYQIFRAIENVERGEEE